MAFVASIVEGHGEVQALPALLHRIAQGAPPGTRIHANPPHRVRAGQFLKFEGEFERVIRLQAGKAVQGGGFDLILLDCDDGCPAELGPEILRKAQAIRPDVRFLVALASREFESWFLASARSLGGTAGLPDDLQPPEDEAAIRDAKGWLSQRMPGNYSPVTHQAVLSRAFELDEARSNRSFARFQDRLIEALLEGESS